MPLINQTRQLQCGAVLWPENTCASYALQKIIYGLNRDAQCPAFFRLFYLFWDLVTAWTMLKRAVPRAARLSSSSQHSWPVPRAESSKDPPSIGCVSETHFIISTYCRMSLLWARWSDPEGSVALPALVSPAVKNLGLMCETVIYHTAGLLKLEEGEARHDKAFTRHCLAMV